MYYKFTNSGYPGLSEISMAPLYIRMHRLHKVGGPTVPTQGVLVISVYISCNSRQELAIALGATVVPSFLFWHLIHEPGSTYPLAQSFTLHNRRQSNKFSLCLHQTSNRRCFSPSDFTPCNLCGWPSPSKCHCCNGDFLSSSCRFPFFSCP